MRVLVLEQDAKLQREAFSSGKVAEKILEISERTLKENLKAFLSSLSTVLEEVPCYCGPYKLKSITFALEINASGGFNLVGKVAVGSRGGLTLVMERYGDEV
jgi:hypothetical protein